MFELDPGLVGLFVLAEARVKLGRTALALEGHRLTHGGYPGALDALVPDILPQVPVDPFDEKPIRYLKDGDRVLVYSVGPNVEDDGGRAGDDRYEPLDIVFTLRPGGAGEAAEGQKP
jgi:hypothetical protein